MSTITPDDDVWLIDNAYDRAEVRLLERLCKLPPHAAVQIGKRTVKILRNWVSAIDKLDRDI